MKTSFVAKLSPQHFVPAKEIRKRFVTMLSEMYGKEVPQYDVLLAHAERINRENTAQTHAAREEMITEHHGAIRVGTPDEMRGMRRLFAVMHMYPVGHYDLSVSNLPIQSTAFRPATEEELSFNGFRIFASMLRVDVLPEEIRPTVTAALKKRDIFSTELKNMIICNEREGGLTEAQTGIFLKEALETFRRHEEANVTLDEYQTLLAKDKLTASICSFKTTHLNHLTPEIMSKRNKKGEIIGEEGIDRLHRELNEAGVKTIPVVQGPPPRRVPILLRQGSFLALAEQFLFPDGKGGLIPFDHTERFGEYETKKAAALTPKGMGQCLEALNEARSNLRPDGSNYMDALIEAFQDFPDDPETLRKEGLIYVRYRPTQLGLAQKGMLQNMPMDELVKQGLVEYDWIEYKDFLDANAAGIFQSNLNSKKDNNTPRIPPSDPKKLNDALGREVMDPYALYAAEQARSEKSTLEALGVKLPHTKKSSLEKTINADPALRVQQDSSRIMAKL